METTTTEREMPKYKQVDYYVPHTRGDIIASLSLMFPEDKRSKFVHMEMKQLLAIYHNARQRMGR